MISDFTSFKAFPLFRFGVIFLLSAFMLASSGIEELAQAQAIINLPPPGIMVPTSISFKPLQLKGILVNIKNPLRFDFLVDKGDSALLGQPLKNEITRLAKYFLTCLTVPENDLWVNLSPYEKDRIVPGNFGVTLMGKDLLEQDYLLKQIMASLSYPENDLGKRFWQKVYRKSYALYGTTNVPINTFNKVWILPKSAQVYVQGNAAFVVNSQLDVMLEADYKAFVHHSHLSKNPNAYSQVLRDVILPELRQEVNEGKNFAVVRQVYNAMILATWYKRHLKDSILGRMYVGRNAVKGVDIADKNAKEQIFQQYLTAYKKCVYNYVKEDYDPATGQTVPRKYASGGMYFADFGNSGSVYEEIPDDKAMKVGTDLAMATINVAATNNDGQIISFPDMRAEVGDTHPFHQVPFEVYHDRAMFTGLRKFFNNWTVGVMFAIAGTVFLPAAAQGATFSPGENGTFIMHVEKGDQLGFRLLDIKKAYNKIDPKAYAASKYNGSLYTVLDRVADVADKDNIRVRQQISFKQIPQNVLEALPGYVAQAVQSNTPVPATTAPVAPQVSAPSATAPVSAPSLPTVFTPASVAPALQAPSVAEPAPLPSLSLPPPSPKTVQSKLPDTLAILKQVQEKRQERGGLQAGAQVAPPQQVVGLQDQKVRPSIAQPPIVRSNSLDTLSVLKQVQKEREAREKALALSSNEKEASKGVNAGSPPPPDEEGVQTSSAMEGSGPSSEILQNVKSSLPWIIGIALFGWAVQTIFLKSRKRRALNKRFTDNLSRSPGSGFNVETVSGPALPDRAEIEWMQRQGQYHQQQQQDQYQQHSQPQQQQALSDSSRRSQGTKSKVKDQPVKNGLKISALDIISLITGAGFGIAALYSDGNLSDIGKAFLTSFLATPLAYAVLLLFHEIGHTLFALVQSPKDWKQILTTRNFSGGYGITDWLKTTIPFIGKPSKLAGVDLPLRKKARRINQKAGFVISTIVSGLAIAVAVSAGWSLPLVSSLMVSSLLLLRNSWETDIKHPSTVGDINCGDSGFIWDSQAFHPANDGSIEGFFPKVFQQAQTHMRVLSGLRGDQGEGDFTWGETPDGDVVPIIFKSLKSKRGKPVTWVVQIGFNGELKRVLRSNIRPLSGTKEVMSHDRFLTQGTPSEEGVHPHLGVIEKRRLCFFTEGVYHNRKRTIVSVGIENGENNFHRKLGEIMPTSKVREFYPVKFHMEKSVYIAPDEKHPKGYYDYLPKGDAPALVLEEQWADNIGDWWGSSRYSIDEIFYKSPEESMKYNLSEDEVDAVGDFYMNVWEQGHQGPLTHEQTLIRPHLKNKNKTLKDSWVDEAILKKHPEFLYQYNALEKLREDCKTRLLAEAAKARRNENASPVGRILNRLQQLHPDEDFEEKVERFVDMTVERFFTADILKAAIEVDERTTGTGQYGVRILSSKCPRRGVFWTRGQSISLGENMQEGFIVYNSEHTALMNLGKDLPPVNEILFLNSSGRGQFTETDFNYETRKMVIRAYSPAKGDYLNDDDLAQWRMELTPDNRYYTPPIKRDPRNVGNEDIADIPRAIHDVEERWDDEHSFVRESGDDLFDKLASRFVEGYIKDNSRYYKVMQGNLLYAIDSQAHQYQGSQHSTPEAQARVASLLRAVQHDPRILMYLKSRLDKLVADEADLMSQRIISGKSSEDDLFPKLKLIDEKLSKLMAREIQTLTDNLINNNLEFLTNFEDEQGQINQAQSQIVKLWNTDNDKNTKKLQPRTQGNGLPVNESIGSGEADFFAAGFEDSLWIGSENLRDMLLSFFPKMIIETDSSNKALDLKPNDRRKVGRRTAALITIKSGATSPSKNLIPVLDTITPGNVKIMTGDVVTLAGLDLGQKYYKGAPFKKCIFPTGHFYLSEAHSTSEVELLINQIELVLYLVKRMKKTFLHQRPWGMDVSDENIRKLEQWRDSIVDKAKRMTAADEVGKPAGESKENVELRRNGKIFGKMLSETLWVKIVYAVFIYCFFQFGAPFGGFLGPALNTILAFTLPWLITTGLFRSFSGRVQRWARLGPPKVTIGDIPVLNQVVEINASKRGGMAISSMDADYHGGNAQDHFGARFLHRIRRGSIEIFGLPEDPHALSSVYKTITQSNVRNDLTLGNRIWDFLGKRLLGGPEIFTIGHGEVDPDISQHHINIGPLETVFINKDGNRERRPDVTEQMSQFYAHSFEVLDRLY